MCFLSEVTKFLFRAHETRLLFLLLLLFLNVDLVTVNC